MNTACYALVENRRSLKNSTILILLDKIVEKKEIILVFIEKFCEKLNKTGGSDTPWYIAVSFKTA